MYSNMPTVSIVAPTKKAIPSGGEGPSSGHGMQVNAQMAIGTDAVMKRLVVTEPATLSEVVAVKLKAMLMAR